MRGLGSRGGRFFDGIFRSARNEATLKTEICTCANPHLEQMSLALERCQRSLEESEGDETRLIVGQLYGLLVHCTGLVEAPIAVERDRLRAKSDRIITAGEQRIMWLLDMPATALRETCEALKRAIEDPQLGETKGGALRELLDNFRREGINGIGLVARSVWHRSVMNSWLEKHGLTYPVLLPSNAGDNGFFERLICTAWPNSGQFDHLLKKHTAPLIYLVAYPFECRWLHAFRHRQKSVPPVLGLKSSEKSELLGLTSDDAWPEEASTSSALDGFLGNSLPEYDFEENFSRRAMLPPAEPGEDSVAARLVTFAGDTYAFLTETLRIPVITELVSGAATDGYKIPLRKLGELRPGDVLVFRDGGRRDVIRAIADAQLGSEAAGLRETAARWHQALRKSGLAEATLIDELEEVNCPRTPQTVRSWLTDDSMIGPQTRTDLEAIAYAVGDEKLLEDASEIWKAIEVLRSAHLSAGTRLSRIVLEKLPQRRTQLREGRTHVEIDDATGAWIVQVESIADRTELRPRSQINTVLAYEEDLV